jgi:hypothetical protein
LSVAETLEIFPPVRIASPLNTMSVPPKTATRRVKKTHAFQDNELKQIDDPDCINKVSGVTISRMARKISGDNKNVGISKRRWMRSICEILIVGVACQCLNENGIYFKTEIRKNLNWLLQLNSLNSLLYLSVEIWIYNGQFAAVLKSP